MTKSIQVKQTIIGAGIPKICVPITGITPEEIISQTEHLIQAGPDLAEWRADYFQGVEDHIKVKKMLVTISDKLGAIPLIFTFRTKKEGGERQISLENYVNLNKMVSEIGYADLLDVELFQGREAIEPLIKTIHESGKMVIASNHHFEDTPTLDELLAILADMEQVGADLLKIAVMPKTDEDVLTLLTATSQMRKLTSRPLITMSMSALGIPSRICGSYFGSQVTFASLEQASAPGQLPLASMKELLQMLYNIAK